MPIYEYRCSGCGHEYQVVTTIAEHRRGKVKCPKCKVSTMMPQFPALNLQKKERTLRATPGPIYITHPFTG